MAAEDGQLHNPLNPLTKRAYGRPRGGVVTQRTAKPTNSLFVSTEFLKNGGQSKHGLCSVADAENAANSLVKQDESESEVGHGQNVRDAFPLADLFVDGHDKQSCRPTISRFIRALFGDNEASPSHDEYGMYMAKSASLRSSALTRQVGAAIFRASGEIISLGCNEVPKAGGGTYWSGDISDHRDFVAGRDPNDEIKRELIFDIVDRLFDR